MTRTEIYNHLDVIDSRDVIARIEELESDTERDQAEDGELATLKDLAEEGKQYAEDWQYGVALIRHSYFTQYAEELADDLGYMQNTEGQSWPFTCIDWDMAADQLKDDYSAVDFDGVEYYVR